MNQVFVEVRLLTWDPASDMPLESPRGLINGMQVEFQNITNAAATAEKLRAVLNEVVDSGLPKMVDRLAPGPRPKRNPGLHPLEETKK